MELRPGQRVTLKKPHPCGGRTWTVLRLGMDVKLRCDTCGRELTLPRKRAEKAVRRVAEEVGP